MASHEPRDPARRRPLLRRAVFGGAGLAESPPPSCVVTGKVLDASPHILSIATDCGGQERFLLMETTSAWRGGPIQPAALRPGQRVVVRRHGSGAADRIWADIGRVCGTIVERSADTLLVDQGHGRGRGVIVLRPG